MTLRPIGWSNTFTPMGWSAPIVTPALTKPAASDRPRRVNWGCIGVFHAMAFITYIVQRCFNRNNSPPPKWCFCYGVCTSAPPSHSLRVKLVSVTRRSFLCVTLFKPMPKRCNRTRRLQMNRPRQTRCFKTQGKKSDPHPNPSDPPRRRANKRRGRGTYANDRPPIVGTVGRQSGQVRLRVVPKTDKQTLCAHVHQFTQEQTTVYTDEWQVENPDLSGATWDSTAVMPPFAMVSGNGQ